VVSLAKGSTSPRIVLPGETLASVEETAAAKELTEAGKPLESTADGAAEGEVPVETVLLQQGPSWEEKVAADLLLTETDVPKSGELYHSNRYYSSSATVAINNEGTDDTYIKFYSEKDELVFSAYIRKGDKIKIQIPGGTYRMKQAFGERWYGLDDMFGNCGRYCECSIGDRSLFNIKRSGNYVISTMGQGDAFTKIEVLKSSF